jgi:hypothetical protein
MAVTEDMGKGTKKLLLPAAAGLAGAGAGLVLTRKSGGKMLPDLGDRGIGEIADDLRSKLDSVVGTSRGPQGSGSAKAPRIDPRELQQRRSERAERRNKRRAGRRT